MTIQKLKTELERRTGFDYGIGRTCLDRDCVTVLGLAPKTRIEVSLTPEDGKWLGHLSTADARTGWSGFGYAFTPSELDKLAKDIKDYAARYGYAPVTKQYTLF